MCCDDAVVVAVLTSLSGLWCWIIWYRSNNHPRNQTNGPSWLNFTSTLALPQRCSRASRSGCSPPSLCARRSTSFAFESCRVRASDADAFPSQVPSCLHVAASCSPASSSRSGCGITREAVRDSLRHRGIRCAHWIRSGGLHRLRRLQASNTVVVVSSETFHPRELRRFTLVSLLTTFLGFSCGISEVIAHYIYNTLCTAPGRPASGRLVAAVLVGSSSGFASGFASGVLVGC